MAAPLVVPSLLLTAVLVVSAAFKLRDPSTSADAFISLRLPASLRAAHLPLLLPYGELVAGIALVVVPTPAYLVVTVLVALLFLAYLVVVVRALTFEEPVHCNCFGRLGLGEVDRRTAARNVLLVVLATVGVADAAAGHSVIQRLGAFGATEWGWLIGVALAIALTWLILGRSGSERTANPTGDAEDVLDYERQPIPYGALRDRETGESLPLLDLIKEQPVLLVFVNVHCGPCVRTLELLPEWARQHPLVRVIVVPAISVSEELPDLGGHVTWLDDPGTAVERAFGAPSYPSAVLLGIDGMLAGGPQSGFDSISEFLDDIAAQLAEAGVEEAAADREPAASSRIETAPTA